MNADEGTAETWTEAGAAGRERLGAASNLEHARLPRVDGYQIVDDDCRPAALLHVAVLLCRVDVLTTDVAHDGMAAGPNLALYRLLAARWPSFAWIASGGVRDLADVAALRGTGVAACVAGTALLEGSLPLEALCSRAA